MGSEGTLWYTGGAGACANGETGSVKREVDYGRIWFSAPDMAELVRYRVVGIGE